jgi:hypothetical protein
MNYKKLNNAAIIVSLISGIVGILWVGYNVWEKYQMKRKSNELISNKT